MTKYVCVLCDEPIGDYDAWQPLNAKQYAHNECGLREVVGGIGHQIAHEYWCLIKHDPDAGLSYRQSALLVYRMVELLGVDEVSRRGASSPGVSEEPEPEPPEWVLGVDPAGDGDEDWAIAVVKWSEGPEPPEEGPPPRPDQRTGQEPGSA